MRVFLVFCTCLLLIIQNNAFAKKTTFEAVRMYNLHGSNLKSTNMEDLFSDWNASGKVVYQRCINRISDATITQTCTYNNVSGTPSPHPTLGNKYVNGETNWYAVPISRTEYHYSILGSKTLKFSNVGVLGVTVTWQCPSADGSLGGVHKSSGDSDNKQVWCELTEIESCPIENPIDALSGDKTEYALDYISPNGLLKVERHYVNQNKGWLRNIAPRIQYYSSELLTGTYLPTNTDSDDLCMEAISVPLRRYKNISVSQTIETYYRDVCTKYLNLTDKPMMHLWLNGKQHRLFEVDGVFLPEGGVKGVLKVEATNTLVSNAAWKMTNPDASISYFDLQGNILKTVFSSDGYITYQFRNNLLVSITDHSNRSLIFNYNINQRLDSVTLPDESQINYTFLENEDKNNKAYWLFKQITWPDGAKQRYSYNEVSNIIGSSSGAFLTGKFDSYDNRIGNYNYLVGKAVSTEGFEGTNKAEFFNRSSIRVQYKDALGAKRQLNFYTQLEDGKKLLSSTRRYDGTRNDNDANYYNIDGQLTEKHDFNGNKVQFAYDPQTKLKTVSVTGIPYNAFGSFTLEGKTLPVSALKTSTQWHSNFNQPIGVATANLRSTIIYHGDIDPFNSGEVSSCVNGATSTESIPVVCHIIEQATTDVNGQLAFSAVIDESTTARETFFTYNHLRQLTTAQESINSDTLFINEYYQDNSSTHNIGDLKSVTNSLGHQVIYLAYNKHGYVTKKQDVNGGVTQFTYDAMNRVSAIDFSGAITLINYDLNGNATKIEEPNGKVTTREYDGAGRVKAVVDGLLNRIENTYDLKNNLLSSTIKDADAIIKFSHTNEYDVLSRLQKTIPSSGAETNYTYDKEGNVITVTDAKTNITSKTYNANNQLNKVTHADTGVIDYTYDSNGEITAVEDQTNLSTQYQYNAFGQLTQLISPDTGTTTFTYNDKGNVLTQTDARGVIVSYAYDVLNRVISEAYLDPAENKTFVYDDTANGNKGIGRLTRVIDQSGLTDYIYNVFGQVTKETRVIQGEMFVTEYHFDVNGQPTSITYPSGRKVTYSFDVLGRVNGLSTTAQTQTKILASGIAYLPFGPMTDLTYGNGKTLTQTYDTDYRIVTRNVSDIEQKNYLYDLTNNISSITHVQETDKNQIFDYDSMSRLLYANGDYGILDFTYDKVGNRLTKNDNGEQEIYNYATDSHHLNNTVGIQAKSLTYDDAGNVLTKNSITFTYNQQGRMKTASTDTMNANYGYSFKGERVSKLVNEVQTYFVYDLNGQLITEADASGDVQKEYIYLNGQRLATITNGNLYYVHTDHLGTPTALTNEAGTIKWKASYTPFGKANVEVNTLEHNIRFLGQYYDQESGLHYNYFRDYDPELGRYIQSDPIGLAGGINTYGYVGGNPVNFSDPLGLSAKDVTSIISTFNNSVQSMTSDGQRISPGWLNNMNSTFGADYKGCQDQSTQLESDLGFQPYDDNWSFSTVPSPNALCVGGHCTHWLTQGISSNPNDPLMTLDPWSNNWSATYGQ